jgi:hypothetical protein
MLTPIQCGLHLFDRYCIDNAVALGTARDEGTSFNWLSAGDCPSGSLPCPVPVPGNFSRSEFEEWVRRVASLALEHRETCFVVVVFSNLRVPALSVQ